MYKKTVVIVLLLLGCSFLNLIKVSSIYAQGGTTTGATSYCTTTNSGVVQLSGQVGTILNWQSTTDGGVTWNNNVNTTPNQTYFNLNQTTCYRAIVQNGGNPPDTSTQVCITIYPESIGGTTSGGGSYCDSTGSGTVTLSGYSGSILHWQFSTNGGASWTILPDTTPSINHTNLTQSTLYEVVVQSGSMCPSDTSTQTGFEVYPQTVAGTINAPASVCATGNSGMLLLTGNTGNVVDWESSTDNGITWNPVGNFTDTLLYSNITQTISYRVIVQSGICTTDTTPVVTITVSVPTIAGTLAGGGLYCGVPATGTLTLTGTTGAILNWISSTNNGTTWTLIANTTSTESYTNLSATTSYAVIVQSGGCAADTSNIEIVNVAPQTVAGTISISDTVCTGINGDTLVLSGNIGNVTTWLSSNDNGITWTTIANTTNTLPYSGLTQTTLYTAIVQSGSCGADTAIPVSIIVVALPLASAGNDTTINQGDAIVLNGSGTGTPLWMPTTGLDDATLFTPVANPATTTTYILAVMDNNNCISTDTINVTVLLKTFNGKVSTLFTPNGDGTNDSWYIEGIQNYTDNKVFVYNIYGLEVYKAEGYINDWKGTYKGKDLPDGTYFYVIRFDAEDMTLRGSVDIIRGK